ncbi:cytidylyltransferase domain-containing protein [Priestia aryabhattai]|uniref:cytidylyltransferase domain-containing protein n=1 Tax=Priestia aryabhattai TaxID=412384 RepID=UPI0008DCB91F|nr:spore coat protein [Priestia aryabhattai]OHY73446.1 spore coat protein [Priestia aryabhattai]
MKNNEHLRLVAIRDIRKGEIVTLSKTKLKQCTIGNTLTYKEGESLFPQVAIHDIQKNTPLTRDLLEKPVIVLVVICRLKSTRLPKKALLPLNGIPSIERCLLNCVAVSQVKEVVLATSDLPQDDPLEHFTLGGKVRIVRGDAENIVSRMLKVAVETHANIIFRMTGDNPAASPEITDLLISEHLKNGTDYTRSQFSPLGVAGDVYTVEALQRLSQNPKPLTHTEYLPFYFINNPSLFSVNTVKMPSEYQYPDWRLTLDEPKDLEMFEQLYTSLDLKREPLFFDQLKEYIINNPEITKINKDVSVKWIDHDLLIKEINQATLLK